MIRKLKSGEYRLYSRKQNPALGSVAISTRSGWRGGGGEARVGGTILQASLAANSIVAISRARRGRRCIHRQLSGWSRDRCSGKPRHTPHRISARVPSVG